MIISNNAQKILKVLHLLAVSYWIGGALAVITLLFVSDTAESSGELTGLLRSSRFISVFVIVYFGALGSFFTGVAYSLCTSRGFFRHRWVILKWLITILCMIMGTYFLSPWNERMMELAHNFGLDAIDMEEYILLRARHIVIQLFEMLLFITAIALSVFKPWEKKELIRLQRKGF